MSREQEISRWISQGQGPARVFLSARTGAQRLGEALVALANTHGGQVFLGVRGRRQGSIDGLSDPTASQKFVLEVAQKCSPAIVLSTPEIVTIQGQSILSVTIPAGLHHVYHYQGRYLHRVGDQSVPLSSAELQGLLLERNETGFETLVPDQASIKDLDMSQVRAYYTHMEQSPDNHLQLLQQRHCIVETTKGLQPTYAGLLLFGSNPQAFLPQAQILLVRHEGANPSPDPLLQEEGGTLPEQIRQAEAFLHRHMRRGRMWVDSERVEVTEYPLEAVREAIVNAVAHRDYGMSGDQIRVSMFQTHLQIYSPGRLPGPITVDNIVEERFSRNPIIVRVLADLGFVERLGYGIDRMVTLMEEANLPAPAFRELRAGFSLTLYGPKESDMEGVPTDPQSLARLGLNERQVQALIYAGEHGQITSRDYQDICPEVSAETLRRDLVDLVSRGMLLKVGERRATYYILK